MSDFDNPVVAMSVAKAIKLVRRMVHLESRGPGDTQGALERLSTRFGLGFWTLSHLRKGNAKSIDAGVFDAIQAAYLAFCESQLRQLVHDIETHKAAGDDLEDLENEARALASRLLARRAGLNAERGILLPSRSVV